jgi:pre-mRNA-splicing factor 38B
LGDDNNSGNIPQEIFAAPEDEANLPMPTHANQDSMNIVSSLLANIRTSDYFKELAKVTAFEALVDQIYYDCTNAVPWVPGTHNKLSTTGMCGAVRGVSAAGRVTSCWCLLFKCFTLKLTPFQINTLINHPDSPYIRVIGFLYLRYCCDPKKLMSWFERYLLDEEEFFIQGEKYNDKTTVGRWLRFLLTELEYQDTLLPRIPVPVMRIIQAALQEFDTTHPQQPMVRSQDSASAAGGRDEHASLRGREQRDDRGRERFGDRDDGHGYSKASAFERPRDDFDQAAADRRDRDRDRDRDWDRRDRDRGRYRDKRRSRSRDRRDKGRDRDRKRSRSRDRARDRSRQKRSASPSQPPAPASKPNDATMEKIRALYSY